MFISERDECYRRELFKYPKYKKRNLEDMRADMAGSGRTSFSLLCVG